MGNGQSLFYPENENRYIRAQQLGHDCEMYEYQFGSKKADLERILDSYLPKINGVMKAFGCNDLYDLSLSTEEAGTSEALARWNRVKNVYNNTKMVSQVICGVMGVVAVGGIVVSLVGFLAGSVGFFASMAITGKTLLVLEVIDLVLDAIMGTVNRSKLCVATDLLSKAHRKIKRTAGHLDGLHLLMPIIQKIHQALETSGYTQEGIIETLRHMELDKLILEPPQ